MVPPGMEAQEAQRIAGPGAAASPNRRTRDGGRVMTHPAEKAGAAPGPHLEPGPGGLRSSGAPPSEAASGTTVPSGAASSGTGSSGAGPNQAGLRARRVILVGARRTARRLARKLGEQPWSGSQIVGFVDAGHGRASQLRPRSRHLALHPQADPVPVLGSIDQLDELVDRARATHVVVAVTGMPQERLRPHVSQLNNSDVSVQWVSVESGNLEAGRARSRQSRHRPKMLSRSCGDASLGGSCRAGITSR